MGARTNRVTCRLLTRIDDKAYLPAEVWLRVYRVMAEEPRDDVKVAGRTLRNLRASAQTMSRCPPTQAGLIFAFRRKRFMGSNCFFNVAKRVKFGP